MIVAMRANRKAFAMSGRWISTPSDPMVTAAPQRNEGKKSKVHENSLADEASNHGAYSP
jgi:hypothetical protein